ncbi:MAG: NADH-quinone oxidoreductase subunit J [Pirellulales bacterium]
MKPELQLLLAGCATFGVAMWLMLPRGNRGGRKLGALLGVAALGLIGASLPQFAASWATAEGLLEQGLFYVLAGVTVAAAAATVTFRNPVYSAIWFALSLLGTSGLFLAQGAQFLGVATIVVYAGAILVTFLFVLMLANPAGAAYYDRLSWEAFFSAAAGAVLVGALTVTIWQSQPAAAPVVATAEPSAVSLIPAGNQVERLGVELFSKHLVTVEVAGTLLLVALVGAVAIVGIGRPTAGRKDHA